MTVTRYRVWYSESDQHVEHKWFDNEEDAKKFMKATERELPKSEPKMKAWDFTVHKQKKFIKELFIKKMVFLIVQLEDRFYVQIDHPGCEFVESFDSVVDAETCVNSFMGNHFAAVGVAIAV